MPKVFIYNDNNVGPNSLIDIQTFWRETMGSQDVRVVEKFDINFDGLKRSDNAVRVIPGGAAIYMGHNLLPALKKMPNIFHTHAVCAGGYWLAEKTIVLQTNYTNINLQGYTCPPQMTDLTLPPYTLLPHCTAIGPFQPNLGLALDFMMGETLITERTKLHPHAVKTNHGNMLYAGGCAFFTADRAKTTLPVQYTDKTHYAFTDADGHTVDYENLAAVACHKANDDHPGTVATGVHYEASVRDSALIRFFSAPAVKNSHAVLSPKRQKMIEDDSEQVLRAGATLLKSTFGLG